jgi:hypothetical protein
MTTPSIYRTKTQFAAAVESLQRAVTFKAWRNNVPVDADWLATAETFEEIAERLTPGAIFKAGELVVLILREDAGRGEKGLHVYGYKQESKARWRRNGRGEVVSERRIYPYLICSMPMLAFEPKPPFRVTRETTAAEIAGRDVTLVEQG